MTKKFNNELAINPSTAMESSTEMECPGLSCDSKLFFPTVRVRKISPLLTETGKPGAFTIAGPVLCVKCKRELDNTDFGYTSDESVKEDEKESTG
jgi:hypothetical protein